MFLLWKNYSLQVKSTRFRSVLGICLGSSKFILWNSCIHSKNSPSNFSELRFRVLREELSVRISHQLEDVESEYRFFYEREYVDFFSDLFKFMVLCFVYFFNLHQSISNIILIIKWKNSTILFKSYFSLAYYFLISF